jgi:cell fate regulator YaaT (PSP1 superfamily)
MLIEMMNKKQDQINTEHEQIVQIMEDSQEANLALREEADKEAIELIENEIEELEKDPKKNQDKITTSKKNLLDKYTQFYFSDDEMFSITI